MYLYLGYASETEMALPVFIKLSRLGNSCSFIPIESENGITLSFMLRRISSSTNEASSK
jgi:hypothetical protein